MKKLISLVLILILGFTEVAMAGGYLNEEDINSNLCQQIPNTIVNHDNDNNIRSIIKEELLEENPSLLKVEEIVEIKDEYHKNWKTAEQSA